MSNNNFIKLAILLALFLFAIVLVRSFDRARYDGIEDTLICQGDEVLVLDMRRNFVCIPGHKPDVKN